MAVAGAAGKKGSSCMEACMNKKRGSAPRPLPTARPAWAPTSTARHRSAAVTRSVTRDEIERYWRRKRMEEEDHLLAAIKAAARIRSRNLKEEDYRQFEASLEGILAAEKNASAGRSDKEELRAVIRDWWTKSKYAYLNQPAVQCMEPEAAAKRGSATFIPNACFYPAVPTKPCSALGVF